MKVTPIAITSSLTNESPEQMIVRTARVSTSKTDDEKRENPEKLINYLIKNKHWSPFEHASITFEIETSRAIAAQLLRHRSFSFQELSQRYANVSEILGEDEMFQPIELRKKGSTNRQSSIEDSEFDPEITLYKNHYEIELDDNASEIIESHLSLSKELYNVLLEAGVASEVARFVLPLATTTKLYMTGSIRSWIHFLELRDDPHAQKEAREIAVEIKKHLCVHFPIISKALQWNLEKNNIEIS